MSSRRTFLATALAAGTGIRTFAGDNGLATATSIYSRRGLWERPLSIVPGTDAARECGSVVVLATDLLRFAGH